MTFDEMTFGSKQAAATEKLDNWQEATDKSKTAFCRFDGDPDEAADITDTWSVAMPILLAAVQNTLALHRETTWCSSGGLNGCDGCANDEPVCDGCGDDYPCKTVTAVYAALNGTTEEMN